MQGLALSRAYYEQYGRPMLEAEFGDVLDRIAVGMAGPGSDCFGFDDEISRDHDFGAGFCLWLTDADNEAFGFRLARAYGRLPLMFEGFEKGRTNSAGTARYGVKTMAGFFRPLTGTDGAPDSWQQWLYAPEATLAAAVNGEVFTDPAGEFSAIREQILTGMPEDVRLKKYAARAVQAAQSGQYNYPRCMAHGEPGAAQLAVAEFVQTVASLVYLFNGRYAPFYKWLMRGMRTLPVLGELRDPLTRLLTLRRTETETTAEIEQVCAAVAGHFRALGLSDDASDFLEPHAFAIQRRIRHPELRRLHIMEGSFNGRNL